MPQAARDAESAINQAAARMIRAQREDAGLTQQQVYELAGIPRATYSKIENGETAIDVTQIEKVAIALNVDPEDFIVKIYASKSNSQVTRAIRSPYSLADEKHV